MNTKPSRIRTTVCSLAVATVLGTATAPAAVAALNTAQIIASAVSQNCISWRVSGICYWLFCTLWLQSAHVGQSHSLHSSGSRFDLCRSGRQPVAGNGVCQPDCRRVRSAVTSGLSGVSAGGANPADMKIPASASPPCVSSMPMRLATRPPP